MLYKTWLDEWMRGYISPKVKIRTLMKYEGIIINKISPDLGEYELREIDGEVLREFNTKLLESGLSSNSILSVFSIVRGSLKKAVSLGLIERDNTSALTRPKIKEREINSFSRTEQELLERYIKNRKDPKYYGVIIALYTGLRIGELLALKRGDIDTDLALIMVNKSCHDSWTDGNYKKILDTPKTESSARIVPIPDALLPYFEPFIGGEDEDYLIGMKDYGIQVRTYQKSFGALLEKVGLEKRGFHSLRHTFATRALECGMDLRTLSEILGHKNPSLTLSRYAHSMSEHKCEMMNKVGMLLK